jgi:hypothetical protein
VRIPIVTDATGRREYHVLGFETVDALCVDFGPFVLLDDRWRSLRTAATPLG